MENVVIIMGSASDDKTVEPAITILQNFKVDYGVYCISAHRAHNELIKLLKELNSSRERTEVIIAAAGMAAALPGVIASLTTVPVIGLPISGPNLGGKDALYSMTQMPPGIPVATVGIDASKNAALLAIRILANTHPSLGLKIQQYNDDMAERAITVNSRIHRKYMDEKAEIEMQEKLGKAVRETTNEIASR